MSLPSVLRRLPRHRTPLAASLALAIAAAASPSASAATSPLQPQNTIRGARTAEPLGDVNGDGIDDFGLEADSGGAIIFGSKTRSNVDVTTPGTLGARGVNIALSSVDFASVTSVQHAGDVDRDGIGDVIINTHSRDYLLYGSRTLPATVELGQASASLVPITGQGTHAVGDVNGDGADDLAIPWTRGLITNPTSTAGTGVWLGGARVTALAGATVSARQYVISNPVPCTFVWFYLSYICQVTPSAVTGVGDVDADGKDDLYVETGRPSGARYLLPGGPRSGTISAATPPPGSVPILADGGMPANGLVPAGDVNGDGKADLLVHRAQTERFKNDAWAVLFGRAPLPATLSPASATVVLATKGTMIVTTAIGDQTGDGSDDLAFITSPESWDPKVKVVTSVPTSAATVDLDALPAVPGVVPAGTRLSNLGDIDADGFDELGLDAATILGHGADAVAPSLVSASLSPSRFVPGPGAGNQTGTVLSIAFNEPATVRLVYSKADGTVLKTETRAAPAGTIEAAWDGKLDGVALPKGDYVLQVSGSDALGNASPATRVEFSIVAAGEPEPGPPAEFILDSVVVDPSGLLAGKTGITYAGTCGGPDGVLRGEIDASSNPAPSARQWRLIDASPLEMGDRCTLAFSGIEGVSAEQQAKCSWTHEAFTTHDWKPAMEGTLTPLADFSTIKIDPPFYLQIIHRCTRKDAPSAGVTPTNFADPAWKLKGNAKVSGGALVLNDGPNQNASAVWPSPVDLNDQTVEFSFTMDGGNGAAEGIALALLPSTGQPAAAGLLGTGGPQLGFGGLGGRALAIDVSQGAGDQYSSSFGWTDGPAASGGGLNWLLNGGSPVRMRKAGTITVKLVSKGGVLSVFVNGKASITGKFALPKPAYLAFTGSTGAVWERHALTSVRVTPS